MSVEKTKPFDYAQDVTKQLLTLATAVVTITVTFLKDIAQQAPADARTVLFIAWALFATSIIAGVATLQNLTGHVGSADEPASDGIMTAGIRFFAIAQMMLFVLAIGGTIYFGARSFNYSPTRCANDNSGQSTAPSRKDTKEPADKDCVGPPVTRT